MSLPAHKTEIRLKGIGVSPGVAIGSAEIFGKAFEEPEHAMIEASAVEAEIDRFEAAVARTREQIRALQVQMLGDHNEETSAIFEAHLLLLEDVAVLDEVKRKTRNELKSIEWAYSIVIRRYVDALRKVPDAYLRERATDIQDVAQRVLKNLRWSDGNWQDHQLVHENAIIFAHDLTPSDTVGFDRSKVRAFATESGSPTSHTAIMARSLNIPAVVALHHFSDTFSPGDMVLIDGYHGFCILNPSEKTLQEYEEFSKEEDKLRGELEYYSQAETRTADGRKVVLSANMEFSTEMEAIQESGAEGVGLYRTEFFYLENLEMRSEERQCEIYSEVAREVGDQGVIIRTLDIGGDKLCPELYESPEPNPFLGWRGIRQSLDRKAEFQNQLRAILRASVHGKVRVMFPFVSSVEEVIEGRAVLEDCKKELSEKGIDFDSNLEVGAMIEIPSVALIAEHLAPHVDFFSIGTNDLVQYTLAVDRVNDRVASLYQPAHPAVIALIRSTVEAAHRHGIWCGICGEAASDLTLTPLWVGLGVDELSVGAAQVLRTRRAISQLDTVDCRLMTDGLQSVGKAREVREKCLELAEKAYPDMLL